MAESIGQISDLDWIRRAPNGTATVGRPPEDCRGRVMFLCDAKDLWEAGILTKLRSCRSMDGFGPRPNSDLDVV